MLAAGENNNNDDDAYVNNNNKQNTSRQSSEFSHLIFSRNAVMHSSVLALCESDSPATQHVFLKFRIETRKEMLDFSIVFIREFAGSNIWSY